MAAITWKNIDTPSNRDASLALAAASQTMNGGFDALRGVLKDYQTGEEALWKKQDAEFTQRQLAKMYAAKTPEELAALQASGEMAMAQAPNGARADMGLINQTMDARPGVIQTREQANWAFDNALRNKTEAPLVGQAQSLIYQGKFADAAPLIAQLSPQNQAVLQKNVDEFQQTVVAREMANTRATAELDRWKTQSSNETLNAQSQATQAGASVTSANAAAENAKANAARVKLEDQLRISTQLEKLNESETKNAVPSTIGSSAGLKFVTDQIKGSVPEAEQARILGYLGRLASKPEFKDAKPAQVAAALLANGGDNWYTWDKSPEANLRNIIAAKGGTNEEVKNTVTENSNAQLRAKYMEALGLLPVSAAGTSVPGAESNPGTTVPNPFASSPNEAQALIAALTKGKNSGESAASASTMSPALQAEYEQQTLEMDPKIKLRKEYSPEIKAFFEKDAAAKKAADTVLFEKRMAAAKAAGLTPPPTPGTYLKEVKNSFWGNLMDPQALNAAIANEQKKYDLFMETIDKRIARTSK